MLRAILLFGTMFLTLWIQKTESCLRHPPHKSRVDGKGIQTERREKLRDEINKRQELYEEERSQLLQEPEYFTQVTQVIQSNTSDTCETNTSDTKWGLEPKMFI